MSDAIDRAQAAEQVLRDDALARHMSRLATRRSTSARADCVDCGTLIPEARRQALPGSDRCTPCQDAVERSRG